ncbi:hypothetical protein QJS10_CPA08g00768 [Acorus calamus]|uniref:Uncharacterized protein n=1 Tax=Acorus calamus TaxID=4465 RepID=A0AAV9E975_ACOCL|nr:hypothetical protein QJS10_CPA08g00768 [Acorus calamus]
MGDNLDMAHLTTHRPTSQVTSSGPSGNTEMRMGRICATRSWISVDRGSKVNLPLTMLRRLFKSSAKDSARRTVGIALHGDHE